MGPDHHRDKKPLKPLWILSKRARPLRCGHLRVEIVGGQHHYRAGRCLGGILHFQDEIAAQSEIPGLDDGGKAFLLEHECNPFGALPVRIRIADEKSVMSIP